VALAIAVCTPVASASSAWSDFVSYTAPEAASQGHASSSRRVLATNDAQIAQVQPSYVKPDALGYLSFVTVNQFIANGTTHNSKEQNKYNIFKLCNDHAKGTSFAGLVSTAWQGAQAASTQAAKTDFMPPQCMYCLTKGYGVDEKTPGFYLPCGCQETCVDVSGQLTANWARDGISQQDGVGQLKSGDVKLFPALANTGNFKPLESCSAYLANQVVYSCPQIAQFHFVLWPSLLAFAAMFYMAFSMMNMSLDMDSLLYTVGGSGKKDN